MERTEQFKGFTDAQLLRYERNKEIEAAFKKLRKQNTLCSNERIFTEIAKSYNITSASVRHILYTRGVCSPGKSALTRTGATQ